MPVPDPDGVGAKVDASSYCDACASMRMTLPCLFSLKILLQSKFGLHLFWLKGTKFNKSS